MYDFFSTTANTLYRNPITSSVVVLALFLPTANAGLIAYGACMGLCMLLGGDEETCHESCKHLLNN